MTDSIKHILVPVDGSPGADKAAQFAGVLARSSNATVTLLVVHSPELFDLEGTQSLSTPSLGILSRDEIRVIATERYAAPAFASGKAALGEDVKVVEEEIWGDAGEQICDFADKGPIDLIVIGSRGRGSFKALLLGSVSTKVLHHATVPITIVR